MLVLGASGVVGQIAIQAARLQGATRVVAAARDEAMLAHAGDLGADALVSLADADDLAGRLREASGGAGFDLVLDPLWGEPAVAAIAAVKPFGRVVNLGQSAGDAATLTSQAVRSTPIDLLGYTNYTAGEQRKAAAYAQLAEHAAAGRDPRRGRDARDRRRARGVAAPGDVAAREARRRAVGTNVPLRLDVA